MATKINNLRNKLEEYRSNDKIRRFKGLRGKPQCYEYNARRYATKLIALELTRGERRIIKEALKVFLS